MRTVKRTYRKTFKCSEVFPAVRGEEWWIKERGKVVELWTVLSRNLAGFTVEIVEFNDAVHQGS